MHEIRQQLVAFGEGASSPVEAVAASLAAIADHNPTVNALPTLIDPAQALAQAERLSESIRRGEPVGALCGLPYVAKDTHRTAGVLTTWGSPIYASHVPQHNDPIVQRLLDADSVLLGKSNVPEFAAGSQTFNTLFGVTRNPYALDRSVGGSSGGAACAIATGMALVADGSDLAASLRNPASFCGVVGHRPSSLPDPLLQPNANAFSSLSMVGTIGATVDDARLGYRAVFIPTARRSARAWLESLLSEHQRLGRGRPHADSPAPTPRDPRSLRIAWTIDGAGQMAVEGAVHRAIRRVVHMLSEAGVTMIEACPDMAGADECFQTLRGVQFVERYARLYETDRARLKDTVLWNIEFGLDLDAARIAAANCTRAAIFHRTAHFMADIDAWLLPTSQVLPFSHREPYPREINGEPQSTYIDWLKSCYWLTVAGHPAISIPGGFESATPTGPRLPVGVQLVGRWLQDEALFDVAETLQSLLAPINEPRPDFEQPRT